MVTQADPSAQWQFSPRTLSVQCGDTVHVTNSTTVAHTWSPTHGGFRDSGNMNAGAAYDYTVRYRGTYGFVCVYHPWMTGKLVVG